MIRAYVPSTLPEVLDWFRAGAIPAGAAIQIVTDEVRATNQDADDEELEFLATQAADEQAAELATSRDHRRAVVAVNMPSGDVLGTASARAVEVRDWAAVFVDDLQWHAVSEIPHLR